MAIATATMPRKSAQVALKFMAIHVSSLRLDTITHFDLYLRVRPDEPAVLYADRNLPFTEESRRRLEENNVQYLYVDSSQEDAYRRYLESNLQDILSDATISLRDKSSIVHASAQGIVKDIFVSGQVDEGLKRTRQMMQSTVDFLFGQRSALRHLIQAASLDYNTFAHSVNVSVMGVALGHRMGFDTKGMIELGTGAIMRDIGMSQVDEAIRDNPGKLTMSEFEQLKQHTLNSEDMLPESAEVSEAARSIIRNHHEKLDGSGYPDGLKGDEIPGVVRLCTIVDIFDALTTHRSHQRALTSYDALRLMNSEMRGEIDMDLLRAFISMMGSNN